MSNTRITTMPRNQAGKRVLSGLVILAILGYFFSDPIWWERDSKLTENYDVSIHVQQDGSLDVEERFDLDVGENTYYFSRNIPVEVKLDSKRYPVAVSDVHIVMDHEVRKFTIKSNEDMHSLDMMKDPSNEDSNRIDAIGIVGKHQFVFQYHIDHGLLKKENGTLKLYWPVNGIWYSASIAHSSVEITFPKFVKYDAKSFEDRPFSESEQSRPISTWKNGNTYHANIQSLEEYKQWGVDIDLPATGFHLPKIMPISVVEPEVEAKTESQMAKEAPEGESFHGWRDIPRAILALMPWILLLICMWRLYPIWIEMRSKSMVTECISYTPPDGLEAAEVGFLIDQYVGSSDLGAAILELELDGFLSIDGYILRSVKDTDLSALPDYKRYLLKSLFRNRDAVNFEFTLQKSYREDLEKWEHDLSYDMKKVVDKLTLLMENKAYVISDSVQKRGQFGGPWGWIASGSFLVAFAHMFYITEGTELAAVLLISLLPIFFLFIFSTLFLETRPEKFIVKGLYGLLFLGVCITQANFLQMMIPSVAGIPGFLQSGLLPAILLGLFTINIKAHFSDKTAKGKQTLNAILGYRNFLSSVAVDRLIEDTKDYSKAYPYAVAFGLIDDWVADIQFHCSITTSRRDHD
ncbi:MAG: DUF2207 domain-containing protein [Mariprofundaceae bacterium]|nr:DUF2207 domain-containing protein [Mariprofundaceae bacterium]